MIDIFGRVIVVMRKSVTHKAVDNKKKVKQKIESVAMKIVT